MTKRQKYLRSSRQARVTKRSSIRHIDKAYVTPVKRYDKESVKSGSTTRSSVKISPNKSSPNRLSTPDRIRAINRIYLIGISSKGCSKIIAYAVDIFNKLENTDSLLKNEEKYIVSYAIAAKYFGNRHFKLQRFLNARNYPITLDQYIEIESEALKAIKWNVPLTNHMTILEDLIERLNLSDKEVFFAQTVIEFACLIDSVEEDEYEELTVAALRITQKALFSTNHYLTKELERNRQVGRVKATELIQSARHFNFQRYSALRDKAEGDSKLSFCSPMVDYKWLKGKV